MKNNTSQKTSLYAKVTALFVLLQFLVISISCFLAAYDPGWPVHVIGYITAICLAFAAIYCTFKDRENTYMGKMFFLIGTQTVLIVILIIGVIKSFTS